MPSGHFTWMGADAADFVVPADLRKSGSWHDAKANLDYDSYQQYAPPNGLMVEGGQVTIVSRDGKQLIVGGAYYPGVRSSVAPALSAFQAMALARELRGGANSLPDVLRRIATLHSDLRFDPHTGRPFYLIATAAPGANGYQSIDALNGTLLGAWSGVDQVDPGQGTGVKGDTKQLSSPAPFLDVAALTSKPWADYLLKSASPGELLTYDAAGTNSYPSNPMNDNAFSDDNKWVDDVQKAGVDAQYYAALTLEFYQHYLDYDWVHDCKVDSAHGTQSWPYEVRSVVHFDNFPQTSAPYDNAFWDEQYFYMVYGDGGSVDRPLSAGQDVVSHELSHAVTQCNSNLDYQGQSGALNESFSDIMATAAEFLMLEPNGSNCRRRPGQSTCADWLIGEDLARTDSGAVIRDMADPGAEGQPSHYDDRFGKTCSPTSGNDHCYVHTNSGISNHAFYLAANGGRNARCSGPTDPDEDCDVMVPPTTIADATKIFFNGFKMLVSDSTFCDARNATIATAAVLNPNHTVDLAATILAWQAVGLGANCDESTDFEVTIAHPTVALASNATDTTQLNLNRLADHGDIVYAVDSAGPATVSRAPDKNVGPNNEDGTVITVNADTAAPDGIYPILVTATGTGDPHYLAASFVIDDAPPVASVTAVGFVAQSTVQPDGTIPLSVTWTATDAASGIASKELDHSPNGSVWAPCCGPESYASPSQYGATAGPHQFQVAATDAVGNDAMSAAFIRTLTAFQETAATYTYPASWKVNNTGTAWGTTKYSTKRLASATLTFTGKAVVWVAQRGPSRGVANVFVDGVKTHVDLYSANLAERRVVFIASNLTAGEHTIKIKVKGTSGRPRVDIDGFFVLN